MQFLADRCNRQTQNVFYKSQFLTKCLCPCRIIFCKQHVVCCNKFVIHTSGCDIITRETVLTILENSAETVAATRITPSIHRIFAAGQEHRHHSLPQTLGRSRNISIHWPYRDASLIPMMFGISRAILRGGSSYYAPFFRHIV